MRRSTERATDHCSTRPRGNAAPSTTVKAAAASARPCDDDEKPEPQRSHPQVRDRVIVASPDRDGRGERQERTAADTTAKTAPHHLRRRRRRCTAIAATRAKVTGQRNHTRRLRRHVPGLTKVEYERRALDDVDKAIRTDARARQGKGGL
jgi:hypothetical protein